MTHKTRTIYAKGKRGSPAAIHICDYDDRIVASAEWDRATFLQILKALRQEYPNVIFVQDPHHGDKDTIFIRGEK